MDCSIQAELCVVQNAITEVKKILKDFLKIINLQIIKNLKKSYWFWTSQHHILNWNPIRTQPQYFPNKISIQDSNTELTTETNIAK